jgi:excinuclease UvrABC nuclease subunit
MEIEPSEGCERMAKWSELFDEGLEVLAPVSDEQISAVPAKRGVVLLAGKNDEPIVMLTAADMRARTRNRLAERTDEDLAIPQKRPDLRQITGKVYYRRCESRFETDWCFLELSRRIWPTRYEKMLSWKPAWFVHIHLDDAYPYFQRTRDVFAGPGSYLGPFANARDADAFIESLQESFDLCRSITCLRRAPNGPRCAYAEMGRCVSPADGTISMDEYREILAGALAFAAGDRQPLRNALRERMKSAAAAQEYERAGSLKTRLERLHVFDRECFSHVQPADDFRYVLVQRGVGKREARAFLAWRGEIVYAGALHWPTKSDELQGVLESMDRIKTLAAAETICDDHGRLRMGLVARMLFENPARRGAALRWDDASSVEALGEAIEANRDELGLSTSVDQTKETRET